MHGLTTMKDTGPADRQSAARWRVMGVDVAGLVTSSRRTSVMDPDLDDDGVSVGGGDCNDADAGIYPGASEVPYDGVDNDCDPLTVDDDLDSDGLALADDCDDADALLGGHEVRSGDVVLSSDADVNAFCAMACTVTQTGSVTVRSHVTDLSGLSCLVEVTDLTIAIGVGVAAGLALRLLDKIRDDSDWTPRDR